MVRTTAQRCMAALVLAIIAATPARGFAEEYTIPLADIARVSFSGFDQSDITYTGVNGLRDLTLRITFESDTSDPADPNGDYGLEFTQADSTLTVKLNHPRSRKGFFRRLFGDESEWRATLTVIGPVNIDLAFDCSMGELATDGTAGDLTIDSSFGEVTVYHHTGALDIDSSFGNVTVRGLNGTFDLSNKFGGMTVELDRFGGGSHAETEFGDLDIHLPRDTGTFIEASSSFGDIRYPAVENLTIMENGDRRLNDGGPVITLNTKFGDISVSADLAAAVTTPQPGITPNAPPFTRGTVTGINVRGTDLLNGDDVRSLLGIAPGETHSLNEIEAAAERLPERHRLIRYARANVAPDGQVTVTVAEADPVTWDGSPEVSFNRVGGVGLGGRLTVMSMYGPLSRLSGGGSYHFANKEWTYSIEGEKRFFTRSPLTIGGSYRRAYETGMDWLTPERVADPNAFFMGTEETNYFQVEGAEGFVRQSFGNRLSIGAAYFEERFSSLKKHTNWSLFNAGHVKEDNPPLGDPFEETIRGMRYTVALRQGGSFENMLARITVEQALDLDAPVDEYLRVSGMVVWNLRFPYGSLLKVRTAGGWADGQLPPQRAFRLGGMNTLRGFDFGMVPEPPAGMDGYDVYGGGTRMTLLNMDYFLGAADVRPVLFCDVGGVWEDGAAVRATDLKRDLGIGLAFNDDFFSIGGVEETKDVREGFRINWAVPVGPEPHGSHWTVNWVRTY